MSSTRSSKTFYSKWTLDYKKSMKIFNTLSKDSYFFFILWGRKLKKLLKTQREQ